MFLKRNLTRIAVATAVTSSLMAFAAPADAALLTQASVSLSDSRPSATGVTYAFQGSNVTSATIRCIRLEFDINADGTGGKPTGLSNTGATFTGNYVPTPASWTVTNDDANGVTNITFATGEVPASTSARTINLAGLTNGSTVDNDFYLRVNTYSNTDCSTGAVDDVVVAYIFTNGSAASLNITPKLSFTIAGKAQGTTCNTLTTTAATTGNSLPLGDVSFASNNVVAQDLTVGTNAGNGYTVYTRYTGQFASPSRSYTNHTGTNATPTAFSAAGTEAVGYTTSDATLSGTANRFTNGGPQFAAFTTSNSEIIYNNAPVASETLCVALQAGASTTTAAGRYQTTVIYTATPLF